MDPPSAQINGSPNVDFYPKKEKRREAAKKKALPYLSTHGVPIV
jgi:hypothetical protein